MEAEYTVRAGAGYADAKAHQRAGDFAFGFQVSDEVVAAVPLDSYSNGTAQTGADGPERRKVKKQKAKTDQGQQQQQQHADLPPSG